MPIPQGFQHAKLEIGSPGNTVDCAFNPTSYTVSKTNIWNFKPTPGPALPEGELGGGLPRRTTLSLLLDVSLLAPEQSIKDTANKLLKMMETDGGGGGGGSAPPVVTVPRGSGGPPKAPAGSPTLPDLPFPPHGGPIPATLAQEAPRAEKGDTPPGGGTPPG